MATKTEDFSTLLEILEQRFHQNVHRHSKIKMGGRVV